jgi:multidrug efflux pump subunit AcrA (membrane-fusion protein)
MRAARRKRPRWIVPAIAIVVLVVVIAVAAYFVFFASANRSSPYQTGQAAQETLTVTVSGSGNATAARTNSVNPTVSGTVYNLRVSLGSRINKGDVLFKIRSTSVVQAQAQAKASLKQARQQLSNAKLSLMQADQKLDQLQETTKTPLPTEDDYEIARQQIKVAKKGVSSAQANLDAAEISYADAVANSAACTVYAPMTGYVTTLNVTNGGSSSGGGGGSSSSSSGGSSSGGGAGSSSSSSSGSSSAALVISDMSSIDIPVAINEANISSVKVGQKATVTFDALPSLTLTGRVHQISQQGTASSGVVTYAVTIVLDAQDKRVKPGMSTTANIITAIASNVVAVPNGAIKTDNQGSYVQVVETTGATPRTVYVTTGLANDTLTEVKTGLKGGETVVTGTRATGTGTGTGTGSGGGGRRGGIGGMFGG